MFDSLNLGLIVACLLPLTCANSTSSGVTPIDTSSQVPTTDIPSSSSSTPTPDDGIDIPFPEILHTIPSDFPSTDDTDPLSSINTSFGVLIKNNTKTSCHLALIDNKAAFVNTNCFDFKNNNNNNNNNKVVDPGSYRALITTNFHPDVRQYQVEKITIHPHYDSKTKANNLAILEYNSGDKDNRWQMRIPTDLRNWDGLGYLSSDISWFRPVPDIAQWSHDSYFSPTEPVGWGINDPTCKNISSLFDNYDDKMFCNQALAPVSTGFNNLTQCPIPYSSVFAETDGTYLLAGLYSYTVTDGEDFCAKNKKTTAAAAAAVVVRNYYTGLEQYVTFAQNTIGRDILVDLLYDLAMSSYDTVTQDASLVGPLPQGYRLVAKDFYTSKDSMFIGNVPAMTDTSNQVVISYMLVLIVLFIQIA